MSQQKLGRNYELTITKVDGSQIIIKPPFTLELDITRKTLGSVNTAQFRLYNLDIYDRNSIRFNAFDGRDFNAISLKCRAMVIHSPMYSMAI